MYFDFGMAMEQRYDEAEFPSPNPPELFDLFFLLNVESELAPLS